MNHRKGIYNVCHTLHFQYTALFQHCPGEVKEEQLGKDQVFMKDNVPKTLVMAPRTSLFLRL